MSVKEAKSCHVLYQREISISDSDSGYCGILESILQKKFPQEYWGNLKPKNFAQIPDLLNSILENINNDEFDEECIQNIELANRIGPDHVTLDIYANCGTLLVEADRLGVTSQSNFSSIRASSCVYKGKWIYEAMLGSKGVMQLGWCTIDCKFTEEEGVGDTENSYGYDGNRQRKWNVGDYEYGEIWATSDVITSTIDCDEGSISFYRNGRCLGEAFSNISLGPGIAYFPAVSLSAGENILLNFGGSPLQYPVPGFRPLQDCPQKQLQQAEILIHTFSALIPHIREASQQNSASSSEGVSHNASLLIIIHHVVNQLVPLLDDAFLLDLIVEKLLRDNCDYLQLYSAQESVALICDLLWGFLDENEMKSFLDCLAATIIAKYQFSYVDSSFSEQKSYLVMMLALLKHELSRKHLLKNMLFESSKILFLMQIKPPENDNLKELVPVVWWPIDNPDSAWNEKEKLFNESCRDIADRLQTLEGYQIEIVKTLLIDSDNEKGAATRFIFLHKFREFLRESLTSNQRNYISPHISAAALNFFHRLLRALHFCLDEAAEIPGESFKRPDGIYVPCHLFFNDDINYFDIQRVGGLYSYLKKLHKDDVYKLLKAGSEEREFFPPLDHLMEKLSLLDRRSHSQEPNPSQPALLELVDGLILLYQSLAHKQLSNIFSFKETVNDYTSALENTQQKLRDCPEEFVEVIAELERSRDVLLEKVTEQCRSLAWYNASALSKEFEKDIYWLLRVTLATAEHSSQHRLFCFMPDFYVNVCIQSYHALFTYFNRVHDYVEILNKSAYFLTKHFADERIVNSDTKETIIQAMACFVCYPDSLCALEGMHEPVRDEFLRVLTAPYESRSWAQTNWILVRLWKGFGFAFRYKHLPHLLPVKVSQQEISQASLQAPCPSIVLQKQLATILSSSVSAAYKLVDSLLNQLNWSFSEFVGMMQELQQATAGQAKAIIEHRQLKLCATCFDISVGLLRVLEMIVHLLPDLLTNPREPTADLLLSRLCQSLGQILHRVTYPGNTFETIIKIGLPGLESVDHFPIVAALCGVLLELIQVNNSPRREKCIRALLLEPGFELSNLRSLLSEEEPGFSFITYKEVSELEIKMLEDLLATLESQEIASEKLVPEELQCKICYDREQEATFRPCGHESCRACVTHHLMSKKDCFFCKTQISSVIDTKTREELKFG